MTDRSAEPFTQALSAVAAFLAALPSPGMVIGGMAVIAHGHVRTTEDIDATVAGEDVSLERLIELAATHEIRPRLPDAVAFARRTQVLLLTHIPTGVHLDLSLAWLPFERDALRRGLTVVLGNVPVRVCSPEDLVIYKLVAARPADEDDVRQMVLRHRTRIDRARVARLMSEFDAALDDGRSRVDLWSRLSHIEDK